MKQAAKSLGNLIATTIVLLLSLISLTTKAQNAMSKFIVNDQIVPGATIQQLENKYRVECIPGNYGYSTMTGAFGIQSGRCTGIGVAGLNIGVLLKATASAGNTNVFISGRELHWLGVQGLQAIVPVFPGCYWMNAYGNFGYEGFPIAVGNIFQLYKSKSNYTGNQKNSYYKSNPWSGETTSFGSDGEGFMYFSSKKADGTTIDYFTG